MGLSFPVMGVHIRVVLEQRLDNWDILHAHRQPKCVSPDGGKQVGISACLQQKGDNFCKPPIRSQVQRRDARG